MSSMFQYRIVPSLQPDSTRVPSMFPSTVLTQSWCPWRGICAISWSRFQSITRLSYPPDTMCCPRLYISLLICLSKILLPVNAHRSHTSMMSNSELLAKCPFSSIITSGNIHHSYRLVPASRDKHSFVFIKTDWGNGVRMLVKLEGEFTSFDVPNHNFALNKTVLGFLNFNYLKSTNSNPLWIRAEL